MLLVSAADALKCLIWQQHLHIPKELSPELLNNIQLFVVFGEIGPGVTMFS